MSGHPPPPGPAGPPPPPGPSGWGPLGNDGTPSQYAPPQGSFPGPFPGAPPQLTHRPGAIPLRPLGLGDLLDGAFRIIRRNAGATVGAAVLVASVAMLLPLAVTVVTSLSVPGLGEAFLEESEPTDAQVVSVVGVFGTLFIGMLLQAAGLVLVGAMTAQVTAAAVVGRRMTLGEAWAATRGRRWRALGLTIVLGVLLSLVVGAYATPLVLLVLLGSGWVAPVLWGVLGFVVLVVVLCWIWIRLYYFALPALMLEEPRIFAAIGRGHGLTRGGFWRIFGIALLVNIAVGIGAQIVATPVSFAAQLLPVVAGPDYAMLALVVGQAVASIIGAAFSAPLLTVVMALQYLDQRIRKEAYDVVLMEQAGLIES